MTDITDLEQLRTLVEDALTVADRQEETLVACMLAQALDVLNFRITEV